MTKEDEILKAKILKQEELLYESKNSIFSRFIVRVKGAPVNTPIAVGCVISNATVFMYQPVSNISAIYPSLELFQAEFSPEFGYEITYLDKAFPLNNTKIN